MPGITRLGSALKDLNRVREIAQILVKHGFGFIVDQLNWGAYRPRRVPEMPREHAKRSLPERVRLLFEDLGPVFTKLGQALSMRPDLLAPDFIQEFSKLQDSVPPVSADLIAQIITAELGAAPAKLFRKFSAEPLAAASIAQVHRATLRTGEDVVVKVQRPGLKKIVESDIEILRFLAKRVESLSSQAWPRRPTEFVNEFEQLLREELDFTVEARHVERLTKNFAKRRGYGFPDIYWDLTTPLCLTQEYISGDKLTELPASVKPAKKHQLAQDLIDAYVLMALEDHFFHADPHPGNFVLDPKGRLIFLDPGQVGRLDRETVDAFTDMLIALLRQDTEALVEAYLALGVPDPHLDRRQLKKDVGIFLEQYYALPLEKLSFGKSLHDLIVIALRHHIELPRDFVVLAKTFMEAEGLARHLNPRLNLVEAVRPTVERIMRQRYSPRTLWQGTQRQLAVLTRFLLGLPLQLRDLLQKLQHGQLVIEFEHKGLESLQHSLDRASNRLSFALIVSALIVGSSLMLLSRTGPTWGGFSLLGLAGYLLAGVFGLWLIIGILRSGRL